MEVDLVRGSRAERLMWSVRVVPAAVVVLCRQCIALLSVLEYQKILLALVEEARLKILQKTRELRRAMYELPGPRRGPP